VFRQLPDSRTLALYGCVACHAQVLFGVPGIQAGLFEGMAVQAFNPEPDMDLVVERNGLGRRRCFDDRPFRLGQQRQNSTESQGTN
jgi:hypothetical protein